MADLGAVAIHYLHDPVPQDLFQKNNNHFVSEPSFTHLALPLVPGVWLRRSQRRSMKPAASRWGAGARTPPAVGSPAQRRDASGSSRARRRPWCRADSARAFKTTEAGTRTKTTSEEAGEDEQRWDLWLALPLQPGKRRVTRRRELVKNKIYSFEQLLGTLDVIVNQRMTV